MRAIADGLFTDEPKPRLVGGRHLATGRIVFPCPANPDFEPYALRRDGILWSYTVQRYRPKSPPYAGPEAFSPWVVAYVELPGEVIVEARLTDIAFEDIRIGMAVEMSPVPLDPAQGQTAMIPAFHPAGVAA